MENLFVENIGIGNFSIRSFYDVEGVRDEKVVAQHKLGHGAMKVYSDKDLGKVNVEGLLQLLTPDHIAISDIAIEQFKNELGEAPLSVRKVSNEKKKEQWEKVRAYSRGAVKLYFEKVASHRIDKGDPIRRAKTSLYVRDYIFNLERSLKIFKSGLEKNEWIPGDPQIYLIPFRGTLIGLQEDQKRAYVYLFNSYPEKYPKDDAKVENLRSIIKFGELSDESMSNLKEILDQTKARV